MTNQSSYSDRVLEAMEKVWTLHVEEPWDPDAVLVDLDIDSVILTEILVAVEDVLGQPLPLDDIPEIDGDLTISKLALTLGLAISGSVPSDFQSNTE